MRRRPIAAAERPELDAGRCATGSVAQRAHFSSRILCTAADTIQVTVAFEGSRKANVTFRIKESVTKTRVLQARGLLMSRGRAMSGRVLYVR